LAISYPFPPGSIQELVATTLQIPVYLTDRTRRDLRLSYAKYEAFLDVAKRLSAMAAAGTWTRKVPTNDEIIEMFVSKSTYFKYYARIFPRVSTYPAMQKWLSQ
jgi:hypothetical protein